jgi:hypothetical protein
MIPVGTVIVVFVVNRYIRNSADGTIAYRIVPVESQVIDGYGKPSRRGTIQLVPE